MESFEQKIERLETIVEILDQGNEPIDILLELYEEGMTLAAHCQSHLKSAEQKILEISQNHGS